MNQSKLLMTASKARLQSLEVKINWNMKCSAPPIYMSDSYGKSSSVFLLDLQTSTSIFFKFLDFRPGGIFDSIYLSEIGPKP